ncbi:MAG: flavodoxin family protein [Planctomycetaceae bacterium]|jgi:multimeric flavodoxin WrbA|nr:flavodoxin family protein [Planctomycetaceae bacterium]
MKILAVNGSPRIHKNTGAILGKIVEGAKSVGAEGELIHLQKLGAFKGCSSCFSCKLIGGKSYGRCAARDALTPVLEAAHEADILVIGSPFYMCMETGITRCFLERLCFQYSPYTNKKPPLSPRKKSCALVYTMNIPEKQIPEYGKDYVINMTKSYMERLFAPCEIFLCTDTKQFDDYSLYEMDFFDPVAKDLRHKTVFPADLKRAFALGQKLAQ